MLNESFRCCSKFTWNCFFLFTRLLATTGRANLRDDFWSSQVYEGPAWQAVVVNYSKIVKYRLRHRIIQLYIPNVRSWYLVLLLVNLIPLNSLEELVLLDIISTTGSRTDSLMRVPVKQTGQKWFGWCWEERRKFECRVFDIIDQLILIVAVVRSFPNKHLVDQNAKQIPVHWFTVATFLQHFWGQVSETATETAGHRVILNTLFW